MGAYVNGVYVPILSETGWDDEVNDFLTRAGEEHINVTQAPYGADPTGLASSSTAIQAAIDALPAHGGTVYVPPGRYKITATLELPRYISLKGAGSGTTLMHYVGASGPMIHADHLAAPAGVTIRDMVVGAPLDDSVAALGLGSGPAIHLESDASGSSNYTIANVHFNDLLLGYPTFASPAFALLIENCLEVMVDKCVFRTCLGGGIYFKGNSNAGVVRDCVMSNNGTGVLGAILVEYPSQGIKIHDNVIEAWRGSYGVHFNGTTDSLIQGTHFEDNWGDSLLIESSAACSVIHNYFQTGTGAAHSALKYTGLIQAASIIGNDIRDAVTLCTDPAATNSNNYVLMGNEWQTGGSLTNNTNATRDTVVEIASRDNWGGSRGLVIHQGPLAHKGTTLGFYGQTPAGRASAYTVTNPTTDRALNVTGDTTAQVAQVLGTLIADLKTYGLLQ